MNHIKVLLISISILHLSTFSYAQKKPLVLSGTAIYTESNQSYYVAGLYLSQPTSDIERILSPEISKRMQLVITKNSWGKRSWTRNWRTRISINNTDTSSNTAIFKDLAEFTTLIKEELIKGDEIIIEYIKEKTIIKINGEVVLESVGSPVMEYLLMTWLGEVPPSTEFRKNILTPQAGSVWQANSDMLRNYIPPENRSKIYSQWKNNKEIKTSEKQEKLLALKAEEEKKLAKIKKDLDNQRKKAEATRLARIKAEKAKKVKKVAIKTKSVPSSKAQAQVKKTSTAQKSTQQVEEEKKLEQDYYLSLIRWQVQRYVYENVTYPHWARNFLEEGLVEIIFLLNKEKEIEIIEKTESVDLMLTREVEEVITRGVQKLIFPEKINTDKWLLNVNYLFSLNGEKLPESLPPEIPTHMGKRKNQVDQKTLLDRYKKTLSTEIKNAIQTPQRAKLSGHKGIVTANITINRWGEVKKINIKKDTRHKYLNEAFITEINKNSPYSVSPPNLKTNEIIFDFEHKFSR